MRPNSLRFVLDVSVGDWLAPRLGPLGLAVSSVVPHGFSSYARVLHPVEEDNQPPTRWADVCAITDRQPHALMQWEAISSPHVPDGTVNNSTGSSWDGDVPRIGTLTPRALKTVCDLLGACTDPDVEVYFGLWDGYGWLNGGGAVAMSGSSSSLRDQAAAALREPSPPAFDDTIMTGPRLRLPHRDYLVFAGPLVAALDLGQSVTPDWFIPQSPNLIWPADHSWCVATEIDLNSTIIGGNEQLIAAILADPTLEAWPVNATDDVGNGDTLNT